MMLKYHYHFIAKQLTILKVKVILDIKFKTSGFLTLKNDICQIRCVVLAASDVRLIKIFPIINNVDLKHRIFTILFKV